jgi:mannitol-1-phosphate/altronate dehydrogenase
MEKIQLNQQNLAKIKRQEGLSCPVILPAYDRESLKPAVVHLGLGNFHRAHEALYLDRLLHAGLAGTGLFEINLVKDPFPLTKIASEQDYLYSLLVKNADGTEEMRVIGAIRGYVNAVEAPDRALKTISRAETCTVSLTITEKGYYWDAAAHDLDWKAPPVVHDQEDPENPRSMAGFLSLALKQRFAENRSPLTVMSCDNFPSNGKTLKTIVLSFCRRFYPEIVSWVDDCVAFPCSMVDRITPNTSEETIRYVGDKYGIEDSWAVCCEDYLQWVLEDDFRLPANAAFDPRIYTQVGAQIVKDVEPYEIIKQTLLNGSHSALAYLSHLLGYTGVADAMADPCLRRFIREHYMEEMTAALLPVEGVDFTVYKDTLVSRFCNRSIGDAILRLAEDGSRKIPNFILKPLGHLISAGKPHRAPVLALAAWARFLAGTDEKGEPVPIKDPDGGAVIAAAKNALEEPAAFLRAAGVQGLNDAETAKLAEMFKAYLQQIRQQGTRKTLEEFVTIQM